ncbi:MAG: hypothetical protein JSR76_07090 [Verrucomicrobia bacterium]|nr:hypothetical protein [Verrucomicrobiota bacterium]
MNTSPPRPEFYNEPPQEEILAPPEKERFKSLLEKEDSQEEDEEKEPLLDGPYTAPLFLQNNLEASKTAPIKAIPSWALETASLLVQPLREATEKGITTIEITVTSKELSNIHIIIDHYDTAPHSFKIQLEGSEIAQRLFQKQQQLLEHLLKVTLPTFQCDILPPTYPSRNSFGKGEREKKSLEESSDFSYLPDLERES